MAEYLTDTNVGNIEYIRKQDMVEECGEWYVEEGPEEGFIGTVSQMLNMFSPADVVQVVRCRECKHNANPPEAGNADCDLFYGMTEQYGFCHRAERRTDG